MRELAVVVVVSREVATCESIRALLEDRGIVRIVNSLSSAQESVLKHRPDLLIVDSILFENQLELSLRQLSRLVPGVPVLVLTLMQEQLLADLAEPGRTEIIRKPFDPGNFLESCDRLLEVSRLRRENSILREGVSSFSHPEKEGGVTNTQLRLDRISGQSMKTQALFPQPLTSFSMTQGLYLILPRLNLFLQALANVLDVEKLVQRTVEGFTEIFGLSFCSMLIFDEKKEHYRIAFAHGLDETLLSQLRFTMDSALVRWLLGRNQCLSLARCLENCDEEHSLGMIREMELLQADWILPLWHKGRLLGMICVGQRTTGRAISEEELDLLTVLSSYVTMALENALFYHRMSYQKSFNESILQYLGSGVLAIDGEGKILSINRNGEKILNLSAQDIQGREIGVTGSIIADILLRTLEEDRCFSRHEFICPGSGKLLGGGTSTMHDQEGRRVGAMMVFADLSEVKSAESVVRQDSTFDELLNLSAWLAHEIKNPLVAINTFTQLLPEKYDNREFREKFFSIVKREVDRLDSVVEDVMEFGKRETMVRRPMDIHPVLEEFLAGFQAKLNEHGIKIKKDFGVKGKLVALDEAKMKIALERIFSDSISHLSEQEVLIQTSLSNGNGATDQREFLRILLIASPQPAVLKESRYLFVPYTGGGERSSGLSLGVAQKILRQHGGWLEIPEEGSQVPDFAIVLPTVQNGS